MSSIVPQVSEPCTTPTPFNDRVSVIRSLLGHRHPSQLLMDLIVLAAQGADWSVIAEADAEARR